MSKKLTNKEFITKSRKIHGNHYGYSKIKYVNNRIKVVIICPEHGKFQQLPSNHLVGNGCRKCKNERHANKFKKTIKQFIIDAKKVHGNKYNYSKVKYINCKKNITIICPKHGEFLQCPSSHLKHYGCPTCGKENRRINIDKIIERFKKVHGDKYDYSKVIYKKMHIKIIIICPKHGKFKQNPYSHLDNRGCPKCAFNPSKGAKKIINFLNNNNIEYIREKNFPKCKYKSRLYFDFYIKERNLCIEYDGAQHFKKVPWWHKTEKDFEVVKIRDKIKTKFCKREGINLLRIPYTKFNQVEEILSKELIY